MSAASESSPARSRQEVTSVLAPCRVQRQSIHPQGERELTLGGETRASREPPGEDLPPKPIGHRVDHAGARDRAEHGERLGGRGRRGRADGIAVAHVLINWFNHLMCSRGLRNPFRSLATRRRR
jgi:hypothetical protein